MMKKNVPFFSTKKEKQYLRHRTDIAFLFDRKTALCYIEFKPSFYFNNLWLYF